MKYISLKQKYIKTCKNKYNKGNVLKNIIQYIYKKT